MIIIKNDIIIRRYYFKGKKTDYFVSTQGDIYSIKRDTLKKLKDTKSSNGYRKVRLSIDGKVYNRNIHKMVAETFIPNPYNKPEVNHIDGNKKHNDTNNLEWVTQKENSIHAYKNNLYGGKNEKFPTATISNKQCRKICKLLAETNLTYVEISKKVGCSKKIVSDIFYRKCWKEISDGYDFSNRKIHKRINKNDVIKICLFLQDNKFSVYEIAEKVGCKPYQVKDIKRKKTWVQISNKYNF